MNGWTIQESRPFLGGAKKSGSSSGELGGGRIEVEGFEKLAEETSEKGTDEDDEFWRAEELERVESGRGLSISEEWVDEWSEGGRSKGEKRRMG